MSVTNIHIKISELQSEIGQALNSAYAAGYCNGEADAIDECIRIAEETCWKDADMLIGYFKELKE